MFFSHCDIYPHSGVQIIHLTIFCVHSATRLEQCTKVKIFSFVIQDMVLCVKKEFQQGDFLLEYRGELLSLQEGGKREEEYPQYKGSFLFFFQY